MYSRSVKRAGYRLQAEPAHACGYFRRTASSSPRAKLTASVMATRSFGLGRPMSSRAVLIATMIALAMTKVGMNFAPIDCSALEILRELHLAHGEIIGEKKAKKIHTFNHRPPLKSIQGNRPYMTEQNVRPSLADLYRAANPCILAFVNKMQVRPAGEPPLFPEIIGTGFFVNAEGMAITNRHVVDAIEKIPRHPQTGERMVGALSLLLDPDRNGCEMLSVSIHSTSVLETFSSSDYWYGQKIPDIGFVQLKVRGNQFLELATERFAIHPGMEVSTIGYPMGTLPLTLHEKVNQISPFIRRGIVSSVYPCPVAYPHGFTIDVMQQGGASGSPIFGPDNRRVVGLMWGIVNDRRQVILEDAAACNSSGAGELWVDHYGANQHQPRRIGSHRREGI